MTLLGMWEPTMHWESSDPPAPWMPHNVVIISQVRQPPHPDNFTMHKATPLQAWPLSSYMPVGTPKLWGTHIGQA